MKWLVTGGAGFIGTNVVRRLLTDGQEVVVVDNLSRRGVRENLQFLQENFQFDFIPGDVRDADSLTRIFSSHPDTGVVIHLAAQVAVTDSIVNPANDFEINAAGTLKLCETMRQRVPEAILLYASTNKVYGALSHLNLIEGNSRYVVPDHPYGISEREPMDFYTPYGCSKGAAEQYVRDYARTYGLRTISFRQSCIYGPHQFGLEDQGWVAWFTIAAKLGKPIKIYGNGKQVRDLLFVDDLVECYLRAVAGIEQCNGEIYNIGGGASNACSLLELIDHLETLSTQEIKYSVEDWRPGDQRIFICDVRKALNDFGWQPTTPMSEGLGRLSQWVHDSEPVIRKVIDG